jgi:hypothetical protein
MFIHEIYMYNIPVSISIPISPNNPVYPVRPVYSFPQFLQLRILHPVSHIPIHQLEAMQKKAAYFVE